MADPNGLVQNLVQQGNLLNQPEVGLSGPARFYPVTQHGQLMWDFGTYNYDLYNTEIARRCESARAANWQGVDQQ